MSSSDAEQNATWVTPAEALEDHEDGFYWVKRASESPPSTFVVELRSHPETGDPQAVIEGIWDELPGDALVLAGGPLECPGVE